MPGGFDRSLVPDGRRESERERAPLCPMTHRVGLTPGGFDRPPMRERERESHFGSSREWFKVRAPVLEDLNRRQKRERGGSKLSLQQPFVPYYLFAALQFFVPKVREGDIVENKDRGRPLLQRRAGESEHNYHIVIGGRRRRR